MPSSKPQQAPTCSQPVEAEPPVVRQTLYDIVDDLAQQVAEIEAIEADPELSDDEKGTRIAALLDAYMAGQESLEGKITACFQVHLNYLSEAAAIKAEEDRLKARRQLRERADARLVDYVKSQMERAQGHGVKTPYMTCSLVTVQDNKVVVDDESKVPNTLEYWKPQPAKLSLEAVKKALKAGVEVPGCRLIPSERFTWR